MSDLKGKVIGCNICLYWNGVHCLYGANEGNEQWCILSTWTRLIPVGSAKHMWVLQFLHSKDSWQTYFDNAGDDKGKANEEVSG